MYSENEEKTKLDWMYKGANGLVDREDYLLGRKIDKTVEQLNDEEKQKELGITQPKNHVEHECIPPSIRDYKLQVGEQVDLATKLQEDPLVLIKKREEESRRQFLQNPVLLKKLQTALLKRTKKKQKKKGKKHKGGDSDDDDLDKKIAEKLMLLQGEDAEDLDLDAILLHKLKKLKNKLSHNEIAQLLECTQKAPKCEDPSDSSSDDSRNRKPPPPRRQYNNAATTSTSREQNNRRKHMTDEEKERLRKEMMENASWRDRERSKNVKRYRDEDHKEMKTEGKYDADFVRKELLKSANSSSVESRIKSNINSIQRGRNDMNTHFSRRH